MRVVLARPYGHEGDPVVLARPVGPRVRQRRLLAAGGREKIGTRFLGYWLLVIAAILAMRVLVQVFRPDPG